MSLVLCGPTDEIRELASYMVNYHAVIAGHNFAKELPTLPTLKLHNKYYEADVALHLYEETMELPPLEDVDGLTMIVSKEQFNPERIAKVAASESEKLRLLVAFLSEDDDENEHTVAFSGLAIEHGFEYIEIDRRTLTKDHDARDKYGLPRLMEALHMHCWSNMRRKPRDAKVIPEVSSEGANQQTTSHVPATPLATQFSSTDMQEEASLASATLEDDDILKVDSFAQALEQARVLRDQISKGSFTDEERREHAANFAIRLMGMMNLDDESDED